MDGGGQISRGQIGPNSAIQLGLAMRELCGADAAQRLFEMAHCQDLLSTPPTSMIDEAIPARLFTTLWVFWPHADAMKIAREAGRRTADYVIAHRIPRLAQVLLRMAPRPVAVGLLLRAIQRNAWTFVGSGTCSVMAGAPSVITIRNNPLLMPDCAWHEAVFQRLFECLIARGTGVQHTACCRDDDPACRFEITLSKP